jgi:CHAT domain-containing protein
LFDAALAFQNEAVRESYLCAEMGTVAQALTQRAAIHFARGEAEAAVRDLASGRAALDTAHGVIRDYLEAEMNLLEARITIHDDPAKAGGLLRSTIAVFERAAPDMMPDVRLALSQSALKTRDVALAIRELRGGIDYYERNRVAFKDEHLRISFFGSSDELYREIIDLQLGRGEVDAAFENAERSRSRSLLDNVPRAAVPFAGPASVQRLLPPKAVFVEFLDSGSRMGAWIIVAAGRTYIDLSATRAQIASLVAQASGEALVTDAGRQASIALYDILIRPVRSRAGTFDRLLISADGALHEVAFAALIDSASGRRLVEDAAIQLVPSATWLAATSARSRLPRNERLSVLAISNPDFPRDLNPNLRTLRGSEAEARGISALYPRSKVLSHSDATPARLMSELPGYDVVHFAGHAVSNADVPGSAYLVLAADAVSTDGRLNAYEIARTRLARARWIVLAGCSTGRGSVAFGEGQLHLARSFLKAGADGVVATRWDVDDEIAAALMLEFHRHLSAGEDPARALAAAQRGALSSSAALGRWADWAAFEFIGFAGK